MPPRLRPEFLEVLSSLRRRIRAFVLVEGTARLVILLGLLFWATLAIDWAWFRVSRLELPHWFRTGVVVGAFGLFVFGLMLWLVLRFLPGLRAKALALVLERRFPELDDRLITAVEMAEGRTGNEPPLTQAMLDRTVDDAARLVPSLQLGSVFEKSLLQRVLTFAAVLTASVIGFGVLNAEAMDRWYKAYILREDHYWFRETNLTMRVVVPPWNESRPFDGNTYKHPKGQDLSLVVEVPEGKRPDGEDWVIPEYVQLSYNLDDNRGSQTVTLYKTGDREFHHTVGALIDGMSVWIKGGDFANREPYRVDVVSPPTIDELVLVRDFPAYTGLNQSLDAEDKVSGKNAVVPEETRFVLRGKFNKPMRKVWLEFENQMLAFGWTRTDGSLFDRRRSVSDRIAARDKSERFATAWQESSPPADGNEPPQPAAVDERTVTHLLSGDKMSFAIPMIVSTRSTAAAAARAIETPKEGPLAGFGPPFVIPPGTVIRIYLEDTDDVLLPEPSRVQINADPDEPPEVKVELTGVSQSITRRALIPIRGIVTDDHGLKSVKFEYRIDDAEEWVPGAMKRPLEGSPKEYRLAASPADPTEKFDILPFDLAVGKKLTLTVVAEDRDDLNGPHITRGAGFVFNIVSNEELLSILYGKELNLRQRFRQIMDEVELTRKDVILHRAKVAEAAELAKSIAEQSKKGKPSADDVKKQEELEIAVAVCAERSLHQVRKNTSETVVIEESFRALLEELVNNRVHTEQMVLRIKGLIVDPLHAINEIDYPNVDGALGLYKLALEKKQDPTARMDDSVEAISQMLSHMEKVLKEMQDLAEFHEAIKELKFIIDGSEDVRKETERKRKEEFLNKIKGIGGDTKKPEEKKPEEKKPEEKPDEKKPEEKPDEKKPEDKKPE